MKRLHEYTNQELVSAVKIDVRVLDDGDAETTDAEMTRLKLCKQLRQFQADGGSITDAGVAHLAGLKTLNMLFLTCPKLTDRCFQYLEYLDQLTDLCLQKAHQITGAEFSRLSRLTRLCSLQIAGCGITDANLPYLKNWPALDSLNISGTYVTNNGLAALKDLSSLRRLWLGGHNFTDAAVPHLQALTGLEMLSCAYNIGITRNGKAQIQQALPHCFIH